MSGYFFDASKCGGLRIQPWMRRPSKLLYQNSSGALRSSVLKSPSFTCVISIGAGTVGNHIVVAGGYRVDLPVAGGEAFEIRAAILRRHHHNTLSVPTPQLSLIHI